jgi:hypothetical protein
LIHKAQPVQANKKHDVSVVSFTACMGRVALYMYE